MFGLLYKVQSSMIILIFLTLCTNVLSMHHASLDEIGEKYLLILILKNKMRL